MQKFNIITDYINEYWGKIYDYYSKVGTSFLVTYYNIDVENTVWDNEKMMGGSYEKIGSLSGIKWNKILLFPVYQITETMKDMDAQDIGYISMQESELVIPSSYGITPHSNDMIKFNKSYLNLDESDIRPIFAVTGLSKQSDQNRSFWKLKVMVEQSRTSTELDEQVSSVYSFLDYNKKIYSIENALTLTRMMLKNSLLKDRVSELFDKNSGFIFV